MRNQQGSIGGWTGQAARSPVEQQDPKLFFKIADTGTEGLLGKAHLGGCSRKTSKIYNGQKPAKLLNFHVITTNACQLNTAIIRRPS